MVLKLYGQHIIFPVLLLILVPLVALAQSNPPSSSTPLHDEMLLLQEVPSVYGASKYEQKVTAAPSSVTVISASEIKKLGYRTLADILQSVRSFFTTNDRNYSYVGVRGFARPGDYNTRVLLLIDGVRINDGTYNQAPIGTDFPLDVDLIDRVEIIRGPSSSIYGSNAFFAVINVITRRGRDLKGAEVSGEAAGFDTYKGRASYGEKFSSGLETIVSGTYFTSAGQDLYFKEFDKPETNRGIAQNCDSDQFHSFFSRTSYRDFTLEGAYVSREKGIPTGSYGTVFDDTRNKTLDERAFVDFKYEHGFESQLDVMAHSFYGHSDYDGTYIYDLNGGAALRNLLVEKDLARNDWAGGEVQVTKKLFEKHKVLVGTEFRDDFTNDQEAHGEYPSYVIFVKPSDSYNYAVYIQDEFQVFNNLILNAGVRYDCYQTIGGTTNPRLALIYHPFARTSLKALYGEAFRAPDAYELYYQDGGVSQKASNNLKPEGIRTYELVWEQYISDRLSLIASGYYYTIRDLISLDEDPADHLMVFKNVDHVEAKGFELELDGKWPHGIEYRLSYCLQEAIDTDTDQVLTNSPRHMAKLNFLFPFIEDRLFLGTELRYLSSRKSLAGNETGDSFITNVTIFSQRLLKGLELSASIYNLFDQKFGDPGSEEHPEDVINQDGITFRLKATYSF